MITMLKTRKYILPKFQNFRGWETSCYFNDSKWGRIALSCSKKTISIIKRNNITK